MIGQKNGVSEKEQDRETWTGLFCYFTKVARIENKRGETSERSSFFPLPIVPIYSRNESALRRPKMQNLGRWEKTSRALKECLSLSIFSLSLFLPRLAIVPLPPPSLSIKPTV